MKKQTCDYAKCDAPPIWFLRHFGNFCDAHVSKSREINVNKDTKFVCKHCKVQVVSREDHHAILGREHKAWCPRSRLGH